MDSPAVVKYTITKLALQHYLTAVLHRSVSLQHYLTPGEDDFYFQNRDYMVNDVAPLGEGGFGTCVFGQNRSDESVFAMKRNNRDDEDKIDSIRSECRMLARIRSHDNVIKFLGAVVDEESGGYPPRVCKMFMELAESKSSEELHYSHRTCSFVHARCSESSEAGAKARPQLPCQASTPMPGLNSHARPQLPCQASTPMPVPNSHARPQLPCQASTPMPGLNSHARPQLPCQSPTPMPGLNSHARPQLPCQASTPPMPGLNSHARPQLPCQASTPPMPGLNSHARPQLPCQASTPPMPGLNSHARPQLPCQAIVYWESPLQELLYNICTGTIQSCAKLYKAIARALQAVLKSHSFTKMIAFSGFPLWVILRLKPYPYPHRCY